VEQYLDFSISLADAFEDEALTLSEVLIAELKGADLVVIDTPVHNFTLPSVLKAWVDHVVRARRTFRGTPEGKIGYRRYRWLRGGATISNCCFRR